jgi:hypothetical protein
MVSKDVVRIGTETGGITAGTVKPSRLAAPPMRRSSHQFLIAEKNPVMGLSIASSARRGGRRQRDERATTYENPERP